MRRARTTEMRAVAALAALAAAWCVATLAYVIGRSILHHLHFAGPYAALFAGDQLRYLAWIRDAGLHGLIANPYTPGASHLYLQPLFLISGILWRAGLSIQLSYLIWTPIALVTLIGGYAAFTGRALIGRERVAALALALLYLSPFDPFLDYSGIFNKNGANELMVMAGHGAAFWQAWGFLPTVIALGLMPLFVLRLTAPDPSRRAATATALAGALVAWLHPWGGVELLLVALGVFVLRRRDHPAKAPVIAAGALTALPLIYYAVLAASDSAWSLSQLRAGTTGPAWPLIFDFGPLVLFAIPALKRRPTDLFECSLLLWLGSVVVAYVAFPGSRDAALEGSTLPLAVLAVKGWRSLSAPRILAWLAIAVAILPGMFYSAHIFRDLFRSRDYPSAIATGEQRAVDSLEHNPPRSGTVLGTGYLGHALPALAGLLDGQVATAGDRAFDETSDTAQLAQLVALDHVSAVVSDCLPGRADLSSELKPLGFSERRYGCERMWLRPAG